MTKKDYQRIANELRYSNGPRSCVGAIPEYADGWNNGRQSAIAELAGNLAQAFSEDNPRFDRARFLKACGIGE